MRVWIFCVVGAAWMVTTVTGEELRQATSPPLRTWPLLRDEADRGQAVTVLDGALPRAAQELAIANVRGRRFLLSGEIRSDAQDTPIQAVLWYEDRAGNRRPIGCFEQVRTFDQWTRCVEALVIPDSAERLVAFEVECSRGYARVQLRNLQLTEDALRFDLLQRPFVTPPSDWGPTRPCIKDTAELLHWSGRTALSSEVFVPIVFGCRSGLPPRTMVSVVFDLPKEVGKPYVITIGHPSPHAGFPASTGQAIHDGKTYDRFTMPTLLSSSEYDAQALLFLKPSLPAGSLSRIGYYLEWEKGRQQERWLEVEMVSIPSATPMKHFQVALDIAPFYWEMEEAPGFADLLRRVGLRGVEISDIVGYDDRRAPTFQHFQERGLQTIGMFSPGFWYPFLSQLERDSDMQARGIDGKPVPTDHGPAACPSYRGPVYQKQMDHLRDFVRYKIDTVTFDEEFFGPGGRLCFCNRCKELLKNYLQKRLPGEGVVEMEEIARNPKQHPEAAKAWAQFKADLITEWYRDYRKALEGEWEKQNPKREVTMYATSQTLAHGAGEVEFQSIMRDNAARLNEGILQGLLPMPYFYDSYYQGSLRKVGADLMQLQRMWGPSVKNAPALFPYLLAGGGGMCYVQPAKGLKYQIYEAFTTGSVSGGILWTMKGMDGWHWKYLAEALRALAKVEDVLWGGAVESVSCTPAEAEARLVRKGDEAVLLVTHYGYDPVEVSVTLSVKRKSVVEDVETGTRLATLTPGGGFNVRIATDRARLLRIRVAAR